MMKTSEVERLAELARLTLTLEEKELFSQQLNNILNFIHRLDQVDTSEIEPMAHPLALENVFREDQIGPSLDQQEVLKLGPKGSKDYFQTPGIFKG